MTGDEYLQRLLATITAPTGAMGPGEKVRQGLAGTIGQWAGTQLASLTVSGSYAKGTAITGGTDVDLFVSLKSDTSNGLQQIYDSLASHLTGAGFATRKQNVSIGITYGSWNVDVVPGKLQNAWSQDHSLWVSRQQTWQKTNVAKHIEFVTTARCTEVIRLMKRWRNANRIEMPSFALELATIRALEGAWFNGPAAKVIHVLTFLRDRLASIALTDPANASNNVAAEMSVQEKSLVSRQASASLNKQYWKEIVW